MKNDEHKQQFAKALKAAMEAKGYPAKAAFLEREFNLKHYGKPITLHGVAKWLRGESLPSYDKVLTLAKWLEIEPNELIYGFDFKAANKDSQACWLNNIGYQEREVMQAFLNLPVPQRKIIREVIMTFSKMYKSQ